MHRDFVCFSLLAPTRTLLSPWVRRGRAMQGSESGTLGDPYS